MKTKLILLMLLFCTCSVFAQVNVQKWKIYEITLKGPAKGNPFTEVKVSGTFTNGMESVQVPGFYDGNGIYKIRFMPSKEGKWNYTTQSNTNQLNRRKGHFVCTPAAKDNHGYVVVKDTFNFSYADGTAYCPFGTTCYAWIHQGDSLAEVTLNTLKEGYFNKMRMCIFPKSYDWNNNEPPYYPFEGKALKNWDYTRPNPDFFRNIEKYIGKLDDLGIQADLIVFHPYDRWGFSTMDRKTDDLYINYIIARFAAYKNVWWSMANEYDLMKGKTLEDWSHYLELFAKNDPYNHLRSIHNCNAFFDHTNANITHASIQREDTYMARTYRNQFKKPIVFDECRYEGNIPWAWGDLSAQVMVEKFWRGFTNGGFVGHGETYVTENPLTLPENSKDVLWWSKGGILKGQSPARIKFLKEIMESAPQNMTPINLFSWMPFSAIGIAHKYYLCYLNDAQPRSIIITLPEHENYAVEIIDTWNMTVKSSGMVKGGRCMIELPAKPYTAVRLVRQ